MRQMEIVYLPLHTPFALKNFAFLAGHEIRETNLGKKKAVISRQTNQLQQKYRMRRFCDMKVNPFNGLDIIQFAFLRMRDDIFPLVCVLVQH